MTLTSAIVALNLCIAPFCWAPSIYRMWRRKSSADYSVWTFLAVEWLQLSNLFIAVKRGVVEHEVWFAFNACTVALTLLVVLFYRRRRSDA